MNPEMLMIEFCILNIRCPSKLYNESTHPDIGEFVSFPLLSFHPPNDLVLIRKYHKDAELLASPLVTLGVSLSKKPLGVRTHGLEGAGRREEGEDGEGGWGEGGRES